MPFVYKIVTKSAELGTYEETIDPSRGAEVLAAAEMRGLRYMQPCASRHVREELRGQPVFWGANGPMWDGIRNGAAVIRYERETA